MTEQLVAIEIKRLSDKYGKSFLDCEDIMEITGLGRDNARTIMKLPSLLAKRVGRRKIVSIASLVAWQFDQKNKEV